MILERKWHGIKDNAIGELQQILKIEITNIANEELFLLIKDISIESEEKSPLILWIQKRLAAMGYYRGYPTGVLRMNTLNSIYKLEKRHNIPCKGIYEDMWYLLLRG